jgi:hypothetical protein
MNNNETDEESDESKSDDQEDQPVYNPICVWRNGTGIWTCPTCDGYGTVDYVSSPELVQCPRCWGSGELKCDCEY